MLSVCKGKGDTGFHWSQCTAAEEPQRTVQGVQENLQSQPAGPSAGTSQRGGGSAVPAEV